MIEDIHYIYIYIWKIDDVNSNNNKNDNYEETIEKKSVF